MKIFPLKPMSNYDKIKNLVRIMEENQKFQTKTNSKILSNNSADKFVKTAD